MSFRFLKKKDGSKVLQQQCPLKNYAWEDVPMVEEKDPSNLDILKEAYYRHMLYKENEHTIILMSKKFDTKLRLEINGLPTYRNDYPLTSFMGRRVYVCEGLNADFKFVKEI
jgi:hypothetical protein